MTGGAGFVRDAQNNQRHNLSQLYRIGYGDTRHKTGKRSIEPYTPQPPDPQKLVAYRRRLYQQKQREQKE